MNLYQIIVFILVTGVIIFSLYSVVLKWKEMLRYNAVVSNTNDSTVLAWMTALKKKINFNTMPRADEFNSGNSSQNDDNKIRYVEIYAIVKNSTNVSSSVKKQLKSMFVNEGIIINF